MKKQDGAEKSKWFLVTKEAIDSILDMGEYFSHNPFLSRVVSLMTPASL